MWSPLKLPNVQGVDLSVRVRRRSAHCIEVKVKPHSEPERHIVLRYGIQDAPDAGAHLPAYVESILRHELDFLLESHFPDSMQDILVVERTGKVAGIVRGLPIDWAGEVLDRLDRV